jgi:hypothetical protein
MRAPITRHSMQSAMIVARLDQSDGSELVVRRSHSMLRSPSNTYMVQALVAQRSATMTDAEWELAVAAMSKWLRGRRLEAHTRRGQTLIVQPKRYRRKRDKRGRWK